MRQCLRDVVTVGKGWEKLLRAAFHMHHDFREHGIEGGMIVEQMMHLRQHAAYGRAMRDYVEGQQRRSDTPKTYWQHLSVRSVGRIETVALAEVLRIEAQGNYAELYLGSRRVLFRSAMAHLEEHLDPNVFIRIHRGTIVRREQITEMLALPGGGYDLRLQNDDRVSVGERYLATVKTAMGKRK